MPKIRTTVISILIVLVLAFVAAVPVFARDGPVFARDGADSGITAKETLTEADWEHIQNLPAEGRETILLKRGWSKVVIPEKANSYEDLISDRDRALLSGEGLELARRNCAQKEKLIPFSEFKSTERWIPPPEELQANYAVTGGWGGGRGDGNSCDFDPAINGDVILVTGTSPFPGIFCHAAIVIYVTPGWESIFSMGADGDRGVCWNSEDELHEYSAAAVERVNTWPWSTDFRDEAKWYARYQKGKPYNFNWLWKWRQDAFYCSQLCWAAYYFTSPCWWWPIDIDSSPDIYPICYVAPDDIWGSWRTSTVIFSD